MGSRGFNIFQLNKQGVLGKANELKCYLEDIKRPEVVCVTETWLVEDQGEVFALDGWSSISSFGRSVHRHGGVAILCNGVHHNMYNLTTITV